MRTLSAVVSVVVVVATAAAAWWLWLRPAGEPPAPPEARPDAAVRPPPPAASEPLTASSAPAAVATYAAEADGAPLAADDASVQQALVELLGREAVLTLLQADRFAERIAATVDNLPRGHVAPRLWPVHPMPGRFTVDADGRVAPANAARYDAFVRLVDSVDPAAAAALYRRLRPQLQAAYENLGYPGRSFHARLLEVIDHLLATPPVDRPAVTLDEVKGPIPSQRPWVRYEFADPALDALSAGQKILVRVGPQHRQRLSGWLRAFRAQIAAR